MKFTSFEHRKIVRRKKYGTNLLVIRNPLLIHRYLHHCRYPHVVMLPLVSDVAQKY